MQRLILKTPRRHDIYAGNRVKELLAQGIVNMRNQERTAEELAIQKRRQTPFHMHINIDMLECVYFLCSMLLEIPAMAQGESSKRRFFSKKFGSQLNYYRRSAYIGPPEHSRDHIIAAYVLCMCVCTTCVMGCMTGCLLLFDCLHLAAAIRGLTVSVCVSAGRWHCWMATGASAVIWC